MSVKRPHVICHMATSIDGKTDGGALREVMRAGEYEALHAKLEGDAWICGRTTMEEHFATKELFVSKTNMPAGPQAVFVAKKAESYAIAVDTRGTLRWESNDLSGDHLICLVSEQATDDYLEMLKQAQISYVVVGSRAVDLSRAVELLAQHFSIRRLLLEGGGHINGGFLEAGLVDEISLLLLPGVDGRHDVAALFDGVQAEKRTATPFKLKAVERLEGDALWLRYEAAR